MPECELTKRRRGRVAIASDEIRRAEHGDREERQAPRQSEARGARRLSCAAVGASSIGVSASSSLEARIADVAQAAGPVLLQAAAEQIADAAWRRRRQRLPVDVALQHVGERVRDCLLRERRAPRQHFEQHAAERPDVGALVERPAARLFRTHVGRRAEDRPLAIERRRQRWRC